MTDDAETVANDTVPDEQPIILDDPLDPDPANTPDDQGDEDVIVDPVELAPEDDDPDDASADEVEQPPVLGDDDDEAAEGATEDDTEHNGEALPDDPFDPANI